MADPAFKLFSYPFVANKGLVARFARDRCPQGTFLNLSNLELREENALSTRYGRSAISVVGSTASPLLGPVHTLSRLKGLSQTYRYAGGRTQLYRRAGDDAGAYTVIATGLNGTRFSTVEYRPDRSSKPFIFIADKLKMLKDDGSMVAAQQMGIYAPTRPPSVQLLQVAYNLVEAFDDGATTRVNVGAAATVNRVNTTLGTAVSAGAVAAVTPPVMTNIEAGVRLAIGGAAENVVVISTTATTFSAFFANAHGTGDAVVDANLQGTVAANTTATVSRGVSPNLAVIGAATSTDDDIINLWVKIDNPANALEVRLIFDVGDGTFASDLYMKSITPATYQGFVSGVVTGDDQVVRRVFERAGGVVDARGGSHLAPVIDVLPDDDLALASLRPAALRAGTNRWTRIEVKKGEFLKTGLAGTPGHTWANVVGYRVSIQTIPTASITFSLDDLYLYGVNGPDVFAGVPYDYRITYYQSDTGTESGPSQTMIDTNRVSPRRQPVQVTWIASPDTQVTHARIYRRGGTLASNWVKVGEIPVGVLSFTDTLSDLDVNANKILEIDNGPPVESTLATRVDTLLGTNVTAGTSVAVTPTSMTNISVNQYVTVGEGSEAEIVLPTAVDATTFTAYFQKAHSTASRVQADTRFRSMHLMAVAFDRVWLAGDPDNPHVLYYSRKGRPETIPVQQRIDVGKPTEPIRAVVEINNNLFVLTSSAIYRILGAQGGVPIPIKAGASTGLISDFAWTLVDDQILYMAGDGVYVFRGGASVCISEPIFWLFNNQTDGPVSPLDLSSASALSTVAMAYDKKANDAFIIYKDSLGNIKRLAYSVSYGRWRNESFSVDPPVSMYFEDDTYRFLAGTNEGMVYQDRSGDLEKDHVGITTNTGAPRTSGTQADDASSGTIAWTNLANVNASDNVYASAGKGGALFLNTHYLKLTNFGFAIPATAEILGIIVTVEWKISGSASEFPLGAFAVKGGTVMGAAGPVSGSLVVASPDNTQVFGSSTDLWSLAWTANDINDPTFGVAFQGGFGPGSGTWFVDYVTMVVYYRTPAPLNNGALAYTLETPSLDQELPKHKKVYQEFTLDANTRNQDVNVSLLFDNGDTVLSLGTIRTAARAQVPLKINSGLGQQSRNVGLRLSGNADASPVDFFEAHLLAAVEAELRQSFDTWWLRYDNESYKVVKQVYIEYVSTTAVTFTLYIEGSATADLSFTLPSTGGVRQSKRVRLTPVKAKQFRWVGTASADFQLYNDSRVEVKLAAGSPKGYTGVSLAAGIA